MAHSRTRTLLIDGHPLRCQLLGRGLFTYAYRWERTVYLLSSDPAKEALAVFGDPSNPHLPLVTRHDSIAPWDVYSMPWYAPLTKEAFPDAYADWKRLPRIFSGDARDIHAFLFSRYRDVLPTRLFDALEILVYGLSNYDERMTIEFPRRNMGVDHQGRLVLRDCIFSHQAYLARLESMASRRSLNAYCAF